MAKYLRWGRGTCGRSTAALTSSPAPRSWCLVAESHRQNEQPRSRRRRLAASRESSHPPPHPTPLSLSLEIDTHNPLALHAHMNILARAFSNTLPNVTIQLREETKAVGAAEETLAFSFKIL